jgi:hypothetical protein
LAEDVSKKNRNGKPETSRKVFNDFFVAAERLSLKSQNNIVKATKIKTNYQITFGMLRGY